MDCSRLLPRQSSALELVKASPFLGVALYQLPGSAAGAPVTKWSQNGHKWSQVAKKMPKTPGLKLHFHLPSLQ